MPGFQNMDRADRQAEAGKRDKEEIIAFEQDLSRNPRESFLDGEEDLSGGRISLFIFYDPKEHTIEALSFGDRAAQHCLYCTAAF